MIGFVKILRHAARGKKLTIKAIGPLMIGTHQTRRPSALFQADFGPAVSAAVPKCPHLHVSATHDDDGILRQFEHEKIARIFHMRRGTGIQPNRFQHDLRIKFESVFADI